MLDDEGYIVEDEKGIKPREYDSIKLLTGAYKGVRPFIEVEVKGAEVLLLVDEDDEFIEIENEKGEVYYAAIIEYSLGKIINKNINQ